MKRRTWHLSFSSVSPLAAAFALAFVVGLGGAGCPSNGVICGEGLDACGDQCADLQRDTRNCGACGIACGQGQACEAGVCKSCELQSDGTCVSNAAAVCLTSSEVALVDAKSLTVGAPKAFGNYVQAAATYDNVLLAADTDFVTGRLMQSPAAQLGSVVEQDALESSPQGVVVDPPYVFVVDSGAHTLAVFQKDGTPPPGETAGPTDGGLNLVKIAEIDLGINTSPQAFVKSNHTLYIPSYGIENFVASSDPTKHVVVRVDVSNPAEPRIVGSVRLSGLDLKSFNGNPNVPFPYSAAVRGGNVYVTLGNFAAGTYSPNGPGLLARIDVQDGGVSAIDLGAHDCLNPTGVVTVGDTLVVGCAGRATYDTSNPKHQLVVASAEKTGLVLVDANDQKVSAYPVRCPADAGPSSECPVPLVSGVAAKGSRVFVGDANAGRLFVVDVVDGGFVERRGFSTGGGPVTACPIRAGNFVSNVGSVVIFP